MKWVKSRRGDDTDRQESDIDEDPRCVDEGREKGVKDKQDVSAEVGNTSKKVRQV